jgi:ubiquinone/menaquinone biosynthesis C-methylase UbiE
MIVLNVGGGASRYLPSHYDGWKQVLLDIDPDVSPDIVCDAKELKTLDAGQFDVVYCSHNLEHFYQADVPKVLDGFMHVLKSGGSVDINVPNMKNLIQSIMSNNLDINDVWYRTGEGVPITFHDVMYGWGAKIAEGNIYYSHKCGFTSLSLGEALNKAGFKQIQVYEQGSNLMARAVKE